VLEVIDWKDLDQDARQRALARPAVADRAGLATRVASIIKRVRDEGDAALFAFAREFDGVELDSLRVDPDEIATAPDRLSTEQRAALQTAAANIRRFHEAQLREPIEVRTATGVVCRRVTRPLDAVGLYVPAGSAPLPSTALMLAVPALVAGCPRRVIVTPPQADGRADLSVLACAALCDVSEVYLAGGAQAVAALAYGTETLASVDKIFGPGNAWLTEAKLQVSMDADGAACDLPAGPSEVLVIADQHADPGFVAADLLSQAEHGADSQVILVTSSRALAERVRAAIGEQLPGLSRAAIAEAALSTSRIILVADLQQGFALSNAYAPEHLILQVREPDKWMEQVTAAGSVFLGPWTPESLGDYCSGTNHVLPTYGFARAWSGLGVEDFQRRITVQEASADGLRGIGPVAVTLARLEGLDGHAAAVERRLTALRDRSVA
jgi:histidinol dehydrogenase